MTNNQKRRLQSAYAAAVTDSIMQGDRGDGQNEALLSFVKEAMNGSLTRFSDMTDDQFIATCKEQCGYDRRIIDYSQGDDGDLKYQTALGAVIQEIEERS